MNTIIQLENISSEKYKMALRVLEAIGINVIDEPEPEFTEKELESIEISHQQAKEGKTIKSKYLLEQLTSKYKNGHYMDTTSGK